jgi:replicative DNA helicase
VDYLQLLSLGSRSENRQVEISQLSAGLKQMARELEVPVITLSQLNRAVEQRQDKRPLMGDLRESGSIEQDADAVMLLYREEYYNSANPESRNRAEVILAKNRNGPTGVVELVFQANMMRFDNLMDVSRAGSLSVPVSSGR